MAALFVKAKMLVEEPKENPQDIIWETQDLEVKIIKENLKKEFALGLQDIFTFATCYIMNNKNKDLCITKADVDAAIIITKYFMKHSLHTEEVQE